MVLSVARAKHKENRDQATQRGLNVKSVATALRPTLKKQKTLISILMHSIIQRSFKVTINSHLKQFCEYLSTNSEHNFSLRASMVNGS